MLLIMAILMMFGALVCFGDRDSYLTGGRVLGGILLLIGGLALLFYWYADKSNDCEERGGTYLMREGKCVTGIKEI